MVKRFLVFMTACFMFMFPLSAHTDVIFEPLFSPVLSAEEFFSRHINEFVWVNRTFYANGESGFVSVKEIPGSDNEIAVIENNRPFIIRYTFNHKREFWGLISHTYNYERKSWGDSGKEAYRWIPMNQLLFRYDSRSFIEEHRDEFYPYTGSYEALREAERVIVWSWPGSGKVNGIVEEERFNNISIFFAYKDSQEREWGFIKNFQHGNRMYSSVWVCISDPANDAIPAFNPQQPMPWPPQTAKRSMKKTDIFQSEPPSSMFRVAESNDVTPPLENIFYETSLLIFLVGVLVISTVVLIRVFWKPNKDKEITKG